MTRVFKIGEEIEVIVDEEFDIRIDDAPQGTYARPIDEGRLTTSGPTGVRKEGGFTFFHFKAIAAGVQKVEFPPTMLKQNIKIRKEIGLPNTESAEEMPTTQPLPGADSIPPLEIDFPPAGVLPIN